MSLDTRNRRSSAIGRGLRFLRRFPTPDGTIDVGDRRQAAGFYRFTLGDSTGAPPGTSVVLEELITRVEAAEPLRALEELAPVLAVEAFSIVALDELAEEVG